MQLTRQWQDEHRSLHQRDLAGRDYVYVYVWAEGLHINVRLDEAKLSRLCSRSPLASASIAS